MIEGYLRLIPDDPECVPSPDSYSDAVARLHDLLPGCDYIIIDASEDIRFFDRGAPFMSVECPACGRSLDEWWPHANYEAWMRMFRQLEVEVPCCNALVSLHNLRYEWPAGFARFYIEARYPGTEALGLDSLLVLEKVLDCKLRQIFATF